MSEMTANEAELVSFSERLANSAMFATMFREGMDLVEETAAYLDGPGRDQSKALDRASSLAYATESMRLTTRLMQLASWLLLHRAVKEGEMSLAQANREKTKVKLSAPQPGSEDNLARLPEQLREVRPLHKLHHQHGMPFRPDAAIHRHDVLMTQPRHGPALFTESRDDLRICGQRRRQQFQRHRTVQPRIMAAIHRPHAAAPDEALHLQVSGQRLNFLTLRRRPRASRRQGRSRFQHRIGSLQPREEHPLQPCDVKFWACIRIHRRRLELERRAPDAVIPPPRGQRNGIVMQHGLRAVRHQRLRHGPFGEIA